MMDFTENMNISFENNTSFQGMEENNYCSDHRSEMIEKIRSLDFAVTDLALYLDTHPEDQKALCLHREYCKELKECKDKYQKVYGPLTITFPCNKWRWLENPWPWERGNY